MKRRKRERVGKRRLPASLVIASLLLAALLAGCGSDGTVDNGSLVAPTALAAVQMAANGNCVNTLVTVYGTPGIDLGGAFYDADTGEVKEDCLVSGNPHGSGPWPLSDFLEAQGTFCFPDGAGGCRILDAGIPNLLRWRDASNGYLARVDYAGLVPGFGTVVMGSVSEKAQKDGTSLVNVNIDATDAFTFVTDTKSVLFGNRIDAVEAGADAALGKSSLRISFFNTAVGAPLPDLVQLVARPTPSQALRSMTFASEAYGELHADFGVAEGSAGKANVTMLNLQQNQGTPNAIVPVDNVKLKTLCITGVGRS